MRFGVGVIGAGVVGGGVVKTLLANSTAIREKTGVEVALIHVCELRQENLTQFDLSGVKVTQDAATLINDPDVQIVCELIGGLEPANKFITAALKAKKHVVTANKMLLAHHGAELCRIAIDNGVELRYEASVAGGIPIIKALREGLVANRIQFAYGILNGTCNYILTRMTEEGLKFDSALEIAIEKGFAERPPDLDILGHDTAHKCQIMASLCFSTEVDLNDIHVEGITKVTDADVAYAKELGYVIKLLAIVSGENGEIEARVHPTLVPVNHLLASVRMEFNAIYVQSDIVDATLYYGRGAGRMPTASAVVADIVDIAKRGNHGPVPPPFVYGPKRPVRNIAALSSRYYLRLTTQDEPGVLGRVFTVMGEQGVSIASCMQKEEHTDEDVHVIIMTHETTESALQAALEKIETFDFIREETHVLRVL
jgi:homoserine dehydrogenase